MLPWLQCDRKDCVNPAKWRPVLVLHPPFPHMGYADVTVGLRICDEHKRAMGVGDVLTGAGAIKVCKVLEKRGVMTPDLRLTQIRWVTFDSKESIEYEQLKVGRG